MNNLHRIIIIIIFIFCETCFVQAKNETSPSLLTEFHYSPDIETQAELGDTEAMWMVGLHNIPEQHRVYSANKRVILKDQAYGTTLNTESALRMIEKSAKKGNPIAMCLMGIQEYYMPSKEKNPTKRIAKAAERASQWYKKAIDKGYGDACALMYLAKTNNVNYNHILYDERQEALKYLYKGIEMQSPLSAYYLGLFNLQDPADYRNAFDCFSLMEEWGIYSSNLTELYMENIADIKDISKAISRIESHPESSHSPYTYSKMAEYLANGKGVVQDNEKAKHITSNILMLLNQGANNPEATNSIKYSDLLKKDGSSTEEWHPIKYKNDETFVFTDNLGLLNRGDTYFIIDATGKILSHGFDNAQIGGDSIFVELGNYKTSVGKDGKMANPIPNQMLKDWMEKKLSKIDKTSLGIDISKIDADGTYGVAAAMFNNRGAELENNFTQDNKTKNTQGKKGKTAQVIQKAMEKGTKNYNYSAVLPLYERALKYNPDFSLAEMNAERIQRLLNGLKDDDLSPLELGLTAGLQFLNAMTDLQSGQISSEDTAEKRVLKKSRRDNKGKQKYTSVAEVRSKIIESNVYNDYVDQLIHMKTWPEKYYSDDQRKKIQKTMKMLRERNGFPKSEWEDWNGKLD